MHIYVVFGTKTPKMVRLRDEVRWPSRSHVVKGLEGHVKKPGLHLEGRGSHRSVLSRGVHGQSSMLEGLL